VFLSGTIPASSPVGWPISVLSPPVAFPAGTIPAGAFPWITFSSPNGAGVRSAFIPGTNPV